MYDAIISVSGKILFSCGQHLYPIFIISIQDNHVEQVGLS